MQSLIILGRQPALGLAELESLYGADKLRPVGSYAATVNLSPTEIDFARLGGMVKLAKVLAVLDMTKWDEIQKYLEKTVPQYVGFLPAGKLRLGLSSYGLNVTPRRLQATGLGLKKIARSYGRSARYIPNVETALGAAQVLHNQLTGPLGWELLFVRNGNQTIIAQSSAVQDIEAYRRRDQERPYRDARIGMLPPKLAQIIINLAVGSNQSYATILDPFCGTGVLLQEALLMHYSAYGTDLEKRMIEYSDGNLKWLGTGFGYQLETADATDANWQQPFDAIATETYLGRPLTALPAPTALQKIISDCDTIHKKFLRNLARQTKPGFRLSLAVPAWKTPQGFKRLPLLDSLDSLGYNRLKFVHAPPEGLTYHRPGQTVGRELLVLIRK